MNILAPSLRQLITRPALSILSCALVVLFGAALMVASAPTAQAATCTFDAAVDNDFNNDANWASDCGHAPTSADAAIITGGTTATLSADSTVASLTANGRVDAQSHELVVLGATNVAVTGVVTSTSGNINLSGGVLMLGGSLGSVSGNIAIGAATIDLTGSVNIGSGTTTLTGLVSNGGVVYGRTGTLEFAGPSGSMVNSPFGTYARGTGTVFYNRTGVTIMLASIYNLRVGGGGSVAVGTTVAVGNDFTLDAGTALSLADQQMVVTHDSTINGSYNLGTGFATSTGETTVGSSGQLFSVAGGATYALQGSLGLLTAGYIDLSGVSLALYGSNNQYLDPFIANNLIITKSGGFSVILNASSTVLSSLTVDGATLSAEGTTFTSVGTTTIQPLAAVTSTSGVLHFGGVVSSTGSIGTVSGDALFGSAFVNNGLLDLGTGGVVTTTGNLTNAGTILGGTGSTLVVLNGFINTGVFTAQTGTVKARQSTSLTSYQMPAVLYRNLNIETTGGNGVYLSASATVLGDLTILPVGFLGNMTGGITVVGAFTNGGTINLGGATVTSTGAFTNSGNFYGGSGASDSLVLGGNLTNTGTFDAQNGIVKYIGSGLHLVSGVVYHNLILDTTGGSVSVLTSSTVVGTLTGRGTSGAINLSGSALTVVGATTLATGNAINAMSGPIVLLGAVSSTGSISSTMGNMRFGSTIQNNGTLDFGSGVATTTGFLTNAGSGTINGRAGTWVIVGGFAQNGTFNPQTGTVIYQGISVAIAETLYNNLRIRDVASLGDSSASTTVAGTLTVDAGATLGIDNTGGSEEASHLVVIGAISNAGTIALTGVGYGPTVTSTAGFTNSGTINAAMGTINLLSSFTNSGTFTGGTSHVRYFASSPMNVGVAIYNALDLLGATTYTVTASTTAVATTTINAGTTLSLGSQTFTGAGDIVNSGTVATGTGSFLHPLDYVRFVDSVGSTLTTIDETGSFFVKVRDQNRNLDGAVVETIILPVAVDSAGGSDTETLTLTETAAASGIFQTASAINVREAAVAAESGQVDISADGVGTATYTDTFGSDSGSVAIALTLTPAPVVSSGGGGGGGGGGAVSGGWGGAPTVLFPSQVTPVVTTPTSPTTSGSSETSAPANDFSSREAWLRTMNASPLTTDAEARLLTTLRADVKSAKISLTADEELRLQLFTAYGSSPATVRLGSGERAAMLRDAFATMGKAPTLEDLDRLAQGLIPRTRNLPLEKAQLQRVRTTFRAIYGHDPNFQNVNENTAWNTLMYRIRFTRDLKAEQAGIKEFKTLFGRSPSDPFQWATVRALGYVGR